MKRRLETWIMDVAISVHVLYGGLWGVDTIPRLRQWITAIDTIKEWTAGDQ